MNGSQSLSSRIKCLARIWIGDTAKLVHLEAKNHLTEDQYKQMPTKCPSLSSCLNHDQQISHEKISHEDLKTVSWIWFKLKLKRSFSYERLILVSVLFCFCFVEPLSVPSKAQRETF